MSPLDGMPPTSPRVLSPALPSELFSHVLSQHVYPTTLVICASRADFMAALLDDVAASRAGALTTAKQPAEAVAPGPAGHEETHDQHQVQGGAAAAADRAGMLLSAPLHQVAVARHIRTVFIPTVSHLRAFLAVFSATEDPSSKAHAPPAGGPSVFGSSGTNRRAAAPRRPLLLVFGLLDLHRDTSEWNAQGLGCTTAALVEATHRTGMDAVVIEPRRTTVKRDYETDEAIEDPADAAALDDDGTTERGLEDILSEEVPVLDGTARRLGRDGEGGAAWAGRTVTVKRVMGRWFRFQDAPWSVRS